MRLCSHLLSEFVLQRGRCDWSGPVRLWGARLTNAVVHVLISDWVEAIVLGRVDLVAERQVLIVDHEAMELWADEGLVARHLLYCLGLIEILVCWVRGTPSTHPSLFEIWSTTASMIAWILRFQWLYDLWEIAAFWADHRALTEAERPWAHAWAHVLRTKIAKVAILQACVLIFVHVRENCHDGVPSEAKF